MSCDSCASAPSLCGTVPKPALHDLAPTVMTNLAALGVTELSVLHRELLQTVSNNVWYECVVIIFTVLYSGRF